MNISIKVIPGEKGLPVIGHVFKFMKDCSHLFHDMHGKYGPVYYNYLLHNKVIHLLSPDGNEFVLLDREKNFSSRKAWNASIGKLFPNGLMLRDADEHRYHRRLMGAPFKANALESYVASMNPEIKSSIAAWGLEKNFHFHPAIKDLTLSLASKTFIGETLNNEAKHVNKAFVDMVNASVAIVRKPMLSNKYKKGLEGRAYLQQYFGSRVAGKQASDDTDMFAEISRAQSDEGDAFSKQDIIDHIIFLMMAAHDTTTSSLSSLCFVLAKHPEWQDRIRDEINAHGKDTLQYAEMPNFDAAGLVLKEALRLYPPLPVIPRVALKDCEFDGYKINRGDRVMISPLFTHRMSEIWTNPNKFDPDRFSKERAEDRIHKHAWVPFGGGAHKCLGIKFAELQIKLMLFHILKEYQISIAPGYEMPYSAVPIGKPTDLLPLTLTPLPLKI